MDIFCMKLVCTSWFTMVDEYISSPSSANMRPSAVLMIPHGLEGDGVDKCFSFLLPGDRKVYKLGNIPEELHDGLCVGSSDGWLIFLTKNLDLCLFNPFSRVQKPLSSLRTFPYVKNIKFRPPSSYGIYLYDEEQYCVVQCTAYTAKEMQGYFIRKAVLYSNPLGSDNKFGLLEFHNLKNIMEEGLGFYDSAAGQWTKLGLRFDYYNDMIYHNRQFYVLRSEDVLEVWDYDDNFLVKTKEFNAKYPRKILNIINSFSFPVSHRAYIVESQGEILYVTRFIAHFITSRGTIIIDHGLGPQDKFQKYKTFLFCVHRMNFEQEKWVEVESFDGCAIFLGGNHSQSFSSKEISGCEENSIYFTDDWLDSYYDGHDVGIYNLEDKTVKPFIRGELEMSKSSVFWFFPS